MEAYKGKGIPAEYTMRSKIEDDILIYRADSRRIERQADKTWKVGEWRPGAEASFDLNDLSSQEIRDKVFGYGIRKVLEDRASQVDVGPDKLLHYRKTFETLASGRWKAEKQERYQVDDILIDAMLEQRPGAPRKAIADTLKQQRIDTQEFLEDKPELQAIYDRIKGKVEETTFLDLSDFS